MKLQFVQNDKFYSCCNTYGHIRIEKIIDILEEKFKSVKMMQIIDIGTANYIEFLFEDNADEAAFLLWSSERIEL